MRFVTCGLITRSFVVRHFVLFFLSFGKLIRLELSRQVCRSFLRLLSRSPGRPISASEKNVMLYYSYYLTRLTLLSRFFFIFFESEGFPFVVPEKNLMILI